MFCREKRGSDPVADENEITRKTNVMQNMPGRKGALRKRENTLELISACEL